jgi:uncharacterized repeat protein (TIGR02543 family)
MNLFEYDTQGKPNTTNSYSYVQENKPNSQTPTDPVSDGWIFKEWNSSIDGNGTVLDDTTLITEPQTFYAQWTPETYTLSFETNGADSGEITSQTVAYGAKATEPNPAPTKEGFTFGGWYTDPEFSNQWDFQTNTMPANDQVLYAKWDANPYTLSFETNGADSGEVASQTVSYGAKATEPNPAPTKVGYTFGGW